MTSTSTKPRVLIIPAAGAGVRFRELGKNYPKCILPVQGTPIIVTAIKMIAEETKLFDLVVISCASAEHQRAINEALAPHQFSTKVKTMVVSVPHDHVPSPAISLGAAMFSAQCEFDRADVDVTVFLSDMLPENQTIANRVANILPDTWGVTEKKAGDFSRWCMVKPAGNENPYMLFYDKPKDQPPTNYAACGVYRYSSAEAFRASLDKVMGPHSDKFPRTTEIQFSEVASWYQFNYLKAPFGAAIFRDYCFKDFGTLEEYLANKGIHEARAFNKVTEGPYVVTKESEQYNKIRDEAVWMQNVPTMMRHFVPKVESANLMCGRFTMEKIRSSNMRDIALYLDRSYEAWVEIFTAVKRFNAAVSCSGLPEDEARHGNTPFWLKMRDKTIERMQAIEIMEVPEAAKEWAAKKWRRVCNELMALDYDQDRVCYYHGDLHFANMFYCFHYKDLKVIDPRGEMRGSQLYDLAKLCHSVYGRYDYIDADLYWKHGDDVYFYDKGHENIERAFADVIFCHLTDLEKYLVLQITASLFLSMIPLHEENAEHCRLFYREYERMLTLAKEFEYVLDIDV